jgi:cation diffusion facilitator family transporter
MDMTHKQKQARKVTLVGALVNIILSVVKVVFGTMFASAALLADGLHSISDLLTDLFVLVVTRFAHEEPDAEHPYGHGRFETFGTVVLGTLLIAVAMLLAYDNIMRLVRGEEILTPGWPALLVALLSIVANEWLYHFSIKIGLEIESALITANAWHHRTDAISSVVVLVGLFFSLMGMPWMDVAMAILVAGFIARVGWKFLWSSVKELVDTSLEPELVKKINDEILAVDGVLSQHNLRTRKMGEKAILDVNIEVSPNLTVSEGHEIASWVAKNLINKFSEIVDVTVHTDVEDDRIEGQEYSSDKKGLLPLRTEVEKEVMACLNGMNLEKQLEEVRLHYVKGRILVEFYLNDSEDYSREFEKEINNKCSHIPWLDKIVCWYAK